MKVQAGVCKPEEVVEELSCEQQIRVCRSVARQLMRVGDYGTAENYLGYALRVAGEVLERLLPDIHADLGEVLNRKGQWREALKSYEMSWTLSHALESCDRGRILNGIALYRYLAGDWNEADRLFRIAMAQQGPLVGKLWAEANLAVLIGERGLYDEALAVEVKLLEQLDRAQEEFAYNVVLSNMLYQYALAGQREAFETTAQIMTDAIKHVHHTELQYDVVDTNCLYAMKSGDLDSASTLVDELRVLLSTGQYSGRDDWYIVRHCMLLRYRGEIDMAKAQLERTVTGMDNVLARAVGHYELALCASHIGATGLKRHNMQAAFRLFKNLGMVPEELRTRRALLETNARRRATVLTWESEPFAAYLGQSAVICRTKVMLSKVAGTDATILLAGESGTGKSMLARMIHDASKRCDGPFVRFDCTCTDEGLIESLLFGHQRGAFTGAVQARRGLVDRACGGTLFIDEIGELPLTIQGKLLSLLDEGFYRSVGGSEIRRAEIRVLVASNRDLNYEVAQRRFREDLLFRIGNIMCVLPPLREHPQDIPILVRAIMRALSRASGHRKTISVESLACLQRYAWPGNTRQLKKAVERAFLLGEGNEIEVQDVGITELCEDKKELEVSTLENLERGHIENVLSLVGGNKSRAARVLGVKRTTLYSRIKVLGLN